MVKGQRTKGNTKPSSSRRTAELLGTEAVNSFIGFSSLSSNVTEDDDIDSDFKVVFKKMSKKDCITKLKALQEFQQLVNEKSETIVKAVLIQWPRLYSKLAVDNDWRVREATHKSQELLVLKIKKSVGPYLKQMMPIWLTSQYDPYTPAATTATASFNTAFPATKKIDALVFTKDSVLNYIKDMLLNQTIETVGEESATAEENKSKYNRLIANCLQGLSSLIASLPSDSLSECQTSIQELVISNKFWKFAKFPDSYIRSSWFKVMSSLAQCLPQLFISFANKICGLTLGGLDEKDFQVIASVWECALLCVITIDDCWKFVNFRKAFYPQLRNILREGGRGNAATIFPNLLPLLSRIPHESTDSFIEFNKEFFTFLREGLENTVSKSQSESNAIISSYMECLRFSISNTFIDDIERRQQFQSQLIQNQLLSLVNDSISTNDYLSKSSLFNDLAILWLYLRKDNKYRDLIKQIADNLADICLKKISENNLKSFSRISRLFLSLFCDSIAQKKEKKIRFRRDTDEDDYKLQQNLRFNDLINDEMAVSAVHQINRALIDGYHSDDNKFQYLELLVDLFRIYTKDSFEQFLKVLTIDFNKFWSNYIKEWLRNCVHNMKSSDNSSRIQRIVDLIVILLSFVDEKQEKYDFLNEVLSLNDPFVSESLFSTLIASNDKHMSDWLQSDPTGTAFVKLIAQLLDHMFKSLNTTSAEDLSIFSKLFNDCLAKNSINKLYVGVIIDKFTAIFRNICLSSLSSVDREFLVKFVCRLASELFSSDEFCTSLTPSQDLLLTIFSSNCRTDDTDNQLLNTWRKGLTNVVKSNGGYFSDDGIISRHVLEIKSCLNANINSIENAERVSKCGFELIDTIYKTINSCNFGIEDKKPLLSDPNIELILNAILLSNDEWNQLISKCDNSVLHYDWLNRDILFDADNCQMIESFDTNGVPFVFSALSTSLLLEKLIEKHSSNQLNAEIFDVITNQMRHLCTATAYLSLKSKSEKMKKFSTILIVLKNSLTNILKITENNEMNAKLGKLLLELSINENGFSTQAFSYFVNNFVENIDKIQYQLSFDNLSYNQIITFQELSSLLPQTLLNDYLVQSLNSFLCCERFVELEDGIAKLAVLHSCLKYLRTDSEDINQTIASIMETFCGLKSSNSDLFYHNNEIESNSELQFYCLICQVFGVIVDNYSSKLSQTHWDLIFLSTTRWIQNIIRQKERLENQLSINIFVTKVFKLVQTLAQKFDILSQIVGKDEYWERLSLEWQEFHSRHLFDYLVTFYLHFSEKEMNFYEEILFKFTSKVVVLVPFPLIIELLNDQQKDSLPLQPIDKEYHVLYLSPEKEKVFNIFSSLLLKNQLPIALSSHQLILRLIPFLLKDVIQPDIKTEDNDTYISPPKTLFSLLQQTDIIVDTMLSGYSIDYCCVVEPNTDSFTYTFAYLLLWVEILEIFGNTCEENPTLRPQMIAFLKENGFLSRLLKNLFRLMPLSTTDGKIFSAELFDKNFTRYSLLSMDESINSSHIQGLSFHLYYLILRQLPAAVREWFNSADRKTTIVVNEITTNHFSGIVCCHELEAVRTVDANKFNNMTVKARPSTREVVVRYTFEEMSFELTIHFPNNYPLNVIKIECIKRFGIKAEDWKKWMLQLMTYLNYQNGSILDALTIFKKNIDKQFEGVEECMICFYVLHGKTYAVPNKFCLHCKKCFHSACLHKWFSTSNNTLCPMCRQLWKF